jgi:DNA-binding winged helix-turn-helix (wHTH) protein
MQKIKNIEIESYQFGMIVISVKNTKTNYRLSRMPSLAFKELLDNKDEFVDKNEICRSIWGTTDVFTKRSLNTHIWSIKKLLKETDHHVNGYHGVIGIFKNKK